MRIKLLLSTTFIFSVLLIQNGFTQDYIITAKGDSLAGKVRMFVNGYDKRVQVTDLSKKKQAFTIVQVKSFTINGERYQPIKNGTTYQFMKPLQEGYLSMYAFQPEKQTTYDGRYLLKKDGKGMEVPNLTFKKNMSKFLEECTAVSSKIEEGEFGRNDLEKIISEFNTCIENKTKPSTSNVTDVPQPIVKVSNYWDELSQQIDNSQIENKADTKEMITEIKAKLSRGEKIPKFLSEGLKEAVSSNSSLLELYNKAMEGNQ